MKKINFLLLIFVTLIATTFSSCELPSTGVESVIVTVTELTPNPEYVAGTIIKYKVTVSQNAIDLSTFVASANLAGASGTGVDMAQTDPNGQIFEDDGTTIQNNNTSINVYYQYVIPASAAQDQVITITFSATDKDGNTGNAQATFTVGSSSTGNPIISWNATLGGQENNSTGSFCVSSNGTVYKVDEAVSNQAKVDFVYFYGATNQATLASPDNSTFFGTGSGQISSYGVHNWSHKNTTRFYKTSLSASQFDGVTNDELIVQQAASANANFVNQLTVGTVIAFVTGSNSNNANKMGLIKVQSLTTGSSGTITLSVKIQDNISSIILPNFN